jgi:hypothetical protein
VILVNRKRLAIMTHSEFSSRGGKGFWHWRCETPLPGALQAIGAAWRIGPASQVG